MEENKKCELCSKKEGVKSVSFCNDCFNKINSGMILMMAENEVFKKLLLGKIKREKNGNS